MINNKTVTGIILAAGNSVRFNKNKNKNFEFINNKPVLSYSLNAFEKNKYIDQIIIAARKEDINKVKQIIENENLSKKIDIVYGGSTRKESVYNCIKYTNSDIVIIHDGARPLIKQKYIINCIESMDEYDGVTIGVKLKDTIKITDSNNIVNNTIDRDNAWIIQTPQCFNRDILLSMHEKYKDEEVTDDCSLLEKGRIPIKILEGEYTNIKITTYEDINIIQTYMVSGQNP